MLVFLTVFNGLVLCSLTAVYARSDLVHTIRSPEITHWGKWHAPTFCPAGMFAIGAQLRVETSVGADDDTALNAVRLLCAPLGLTNRHETVSADEGSFGAWRTEYYCKESLVTGFTLRSEAYTGGSFPFTSLVWSDNTAANNVKILCSDQVEHEMDGMNWGSWTKRQVCPKGSAVCGVEVQTEEPRGTKDDTALNNLNMQCCKIRVNACKPTDEWRMIQSCDNRGNPTPIKCTYTYTVGTSISSKVSETVRKETELSWKISAQVGLNVEVFSAQFTQELGVSHTTGYDWTKEKETTFTKETTATSEFEVPGYTIKLMEQVVGSCGDKMVSTTYTRFNETSEDQSKITYATL